MEKAKVIEILKAANAAPYVPAKVTSGCGRAYVTLLGLAKSDRKMFEAACKEVGLLFLKKAYGTSGNSIYIGYDNADGHALAKAEAFAKVLTENGLRCYTDAVGD